MKDDQVLIEARRAAAAWGLTWEHWTEVAADRRYLVSALKVPCAHTADCHHVIAGVHGLN